MVSEVLTVIILNAVPMITDLTTRKSVFPVYTAYMPSCWPKRIKLNNPALT